MHSTVAVARGFARGIKGTGISSDPIPPHSATTLLHQAPKRSKQSAHDKESGAEELEHYEDDDEVIPALTVLKKTD